MADMYDFEDIEDYVLERMTPSDHADFEAVLASDPALQRRVAAFRAEQEVLRYMRRAELKEKFSKWRTEAAPIIPQAPDLGKRMGKRRKNTRWIMMAVLCLIGLAAGYWFYYHSQQTIVQQAIPAPELPARTVDSTQISAPNQALPPPIVQPPQASVEFNNWPALGGIVHTSLLKKDALMGSKQRYLADSVLVLIDQNKLEQALQFVYTADTTKSSVQLCLAHLYWLQGDHSRAVRWYGAVKKNPDNVRFQLDAQLNEIACYIYLLPSSRTVLLPLLKPVIKHPEDYSLSGERKRTLQIVWKRINSKD